MRNPQSNTLDLNPLLPLFVNVVATIPSGGRSSTSINFSSKRAGKRSCLYQDQRPGTSCCRVGAIASHFSGSGRNPSAFFGRQR